MRKEESYSRNRSGDAVCMYKLVNAHINIMGEITYSDPGLLCLRAHFNFVREGNAKNGRVFRVSHPCKIKMGT